MFRKKLLIFLVSIISLTIMTSCDILTKTAERCATPVFSPTGGQYADAQNVSITCATSGVSIRYTTDESDPTSSSTIYTSPISITAATTLKAKAFKSDWTSSHIASTKYTIGTTPGQFVFVPGGTFTMGNTLGGGDSNERPTHSVTLSAFYMGKYEVTQSEWETIMGGNPANYYGVGDNYPVYWVSWYSVLKYCNLRSMAESLTPVYTISGSTNPSDWGSTPDVNHVPNSAWDSAICNWSADGYRLPTEAEWEYAARGGTSIPDYPYSGSDDINAVAWYYGNDTLYYGSTKPVGTKAANGLGIYDMSGNVVEWCWDWYGSYSSAAQNNPTGPVSGSDRLLRGGAFYGSASSCRVSLRFGSMPVIVFNFERYGFRVCRTNL